MTMTNIKITRIDTGYVIENSFGKLELTWADCCEISRFIDHCDALSEIEEYVVQYDDESSMEAFGKKSASIIGDKELMNKIAQQLIKNRISNESTDDIYEAIRELS